MPPDSPSLSASESFWVSIDPQTRRVFLKQIAVAGAGVAVTANLATAQQTTTPQPPPISPAAELLDVHLKINGRDVDLAIDPRVTLLDALREVVQLTGTKKGCDHGQCGACTVLVNGRRINSCLSLAVTHDGDEVTTVEGLAQGDVLHPVQAAFLEHDGFQCGYCTPGQICSAVALLQEDHAHDDEEIREWMSGNLCRCGAYANIVAAIREAKSKTDTAA